MLYGSESMRKSIPVFLIILSVICVVLFIITTFFTVKNLNKYLNHSFKTVTAAKAEYDPCFYDPNPKTQALYINVEDRNGKKASVYVSAQFYFDKSGFENEMDKGAEMYITIDESRDLFGADDFAEAYAVYTDDTNILSLEDGMKDEKTNVIICAVFALLSFAASAYLIYAVIDEYIIN